MTIIGFDVSKDELVGVRINRSVQVLETFTIANNQPAIGEFLKRAVIEHKRLTIACESTGEYHRALACTCVELGIPFRLLNPIIVKQFTRATVRKKKTDASDALSIAKLALQGEGRLLTTVVYPTATLVSRTATRFSRMIQMLNLMDGRLKRHCPEETDLPEHIERARAVLLESVEALRKRVQTECDSKVVRLLCFVPGVCPTLAGIFIAEIQDFHRFPSGKTLVGYAGLDPRIRQSGYSLKRNTRLTKRGSPYLRRSLYIGASIAQRCDPELRSYFEKKMNERKRYKEATVSVACKLIYRLYAVWRRGTPFIPNRQLS